MTMLGSELNLASGLRGPAAEPEGIGAARSPIRAGTLISEQHACLCTDYLVLRTLCATAV
jgi:hypothetical protein